MMHLSTPKVTLIGLLLAAALGAQDEPADKSTTKPSVSKPTSSSYYPLAEDATWQYRDTGGAEGTPVACEYRCLGRVAVKDGTCYELSYRRGKYRNWEYWASNKNGVFRFHRGYLGGWRGVARNRAPQRILAGPVGATLTWKWTEMGSVQTMAGAPQPDRETLKIHYTARIEEMQDKVKVPAGEFTAVRLRITSKGFYVTDMTWWFAKGVGPVKRLEKGRGDNPDRVFELTKFTPGIDVQETADATARRFLRKNQPWDRLDEPNQFRHMKQRFLSDHFRNQFFLVRWPKRDQTLFLRVRRGVARVFDPADIKHWRELLKDESIQLNNNAMGFGNAGQAIRYCGQAFALFVGELQGPHFKPYIRSGDFVTSHAFREGTITVKGKVRSGARGRNPVIPVIMKFDDKTLIKLKSGGLKRQPAQAQGPAPAGQRKIGR
ncbi:MAG: hypothetical protein ACYTGW_08030 [Planctomycetota bacterium]|jgi:hypothetical protein